MHQALRLVPSVGVSRAVALGVAWVLVLATGCRPPAQVTVGISPGNAQVEAGGTHQFFAEARGAADASVTWSVVEPGGGTVTDSGLYTAPQTPGTYTVRATSRAAPGVSADARVAVTAALPGVSISVSPDAQALLFGEQVTFTATVQNARDTSVTWSVEGGDANGTVTAAGVYTAPERVGTFRVVARASADASKTASATVTVSRPAPSLRLALSRLAVGKGMPATVGLEVLHGTGAEDITVSLLEPEAGSAFYAPGLQAVYYVAPEQVGSYTLVASLVGRPTSEVRLPITVTQTPPRAVLRGTVHASGTPSGRIVISYGPADESGQLMQVLATTSLEAAGDFTLQPLYSVDGQRLAVRAFVDRLGTGFFNAAADPSATVPFSFGGEDVTVDLTLQEPEALASLTMDGAPAAVGGPDSLAVMFPPAQVNEAAGERAEEYVLTWSTAAVPGPADAVGTLTVPAGRSRVEELGYLVSIPGVAPGDYHVWLTPRSGGVQGTRVQAWSTARVGGTPPAGSAALGGTVHLEGVTTSGAASLLVLVYGFDTGAYLLRRVPVTGADVTWTVDGLGQGGHSVFLLLDTDGDGLFALTEPGMRTGQQVTTSGASTAFPAVTFSGAALLPRVATSRTGLVTDTGILATGAEVLLQVAPGSKRPVKVQLTGGQGLPFPYDAATAFDLPLSLGSFGLRAQYGAVPFPLAQGTTFEATVGLEDGTSASLGLALEGLVPLPDGFTLESTSPLTPTFTWTLPFALPAGSSALLVVSDPGAINEGGELWRRTLTSADLVSTSPVTYRVTYGDVGAARALPSGWRWTLSMTDARAAHRCELMGGVNVPP